MLKKDAHTNITDNQADPPSERHGGPTEDFNCDTLRAQADLVLRNHDAEICFCGAKRYEIRSLADGTQVSTLVADSLRDWHGDLRELYVQLEEARYTLLKQIPTDFLQKKLAAIDPSTLPCDTMGPEKQLLEIPKKPIPSLRELLGQSQEEFKFEPPDLTKSIPRIAAYIQEKIELGNRSVREQPGQSQEEFKFEAPDLIKSIPRLAAYIEEKTNLTNYASRFRERMRIEKQITELGKSLTDFNPERLFQCEEEFIFGIKALEKLIPEIGDDSTYKQQMTRITNLSSVISAIHRRLSEDIGVLRQIHADRVALSQRVHALADSITSEPVHLYLDDNEIGSGILGRHKLLAQSVKELAPDLEISIFASIKARGTNVFHPEHALDQIAFRHVGANDFENCMQGARIHIYETVDPTSFNAFKGAGHLLMQSTCMPGLSLQYPSAPTTEGELVHITTSDYYKSPLRLHLQDPLSSYPLDLILNRNAQKAQSFDLQTLTQSRSEWLRDAIDSHRTTALNKSANNSGFDVTRSVWSWAYFVDSTKFLDEMQILSASLKNPKFEEQNIFVEGGRQIIIFASPSRYLNREVQISEFTDLGFTVISGAGEIATPQENTTALPVTIVWTSGISNNYVRTLVSELCGTSALGSNGTRIKFPLYCTGNASYQEAISAGQIALHDDIDIGKGYGLQMITCLWRRVAAAMHISDGEFEKFVRDESKSVLMGDSTHHELYLNLASWTNKMNLFCTHLMPYNSAYDIIQGIAQFQARQLQIADSAD